MLVSAFFDIYKKIFHFFVFFSCYLLISLFRKYFLRNNSFFGVFFAVGTLDVSVVRRCGGGGAVLETSVEAMRPVLESGVEALEIVVEVVGPV